MHCILGMMLPICDWQADYSSFAHDNSTVDSLCKLLCQIISRFLQITLIIFWTSWPKNQSMPSINKFIWLSIVISTTLLIFNKSGKKVSKICRITEQAESSTLTSSCNGHLHDLDISLVATSMSWQEFLLVNNTSYIIDLPVLVM